jgi:hypothetical protein
MRWRVCLGEIILDRHEQCKQWSSGLGSDTQLCVTAQTNSDINTVTLYYNWTTCRISEILKMVWCQPLGTVNTGLQFPEQHIKCTQQLHTSQGRHCTIVVSYGATSVHVKMGPVSIPSTVLMLNFLPKSSQYLHPFRILRKSIPSGFSFYFCTHFYASAQILVNSTLAHYHYHQQ